MLISHINKMVGGWYIGNFTPSLLKTKNFEVGYKLHKKDEKWPVHVHKIATEYNFLISGIMKIANTELRSGDLFIIYPNEISDPQFITDCQVITVKVPSIVGDKYDVSVETNNDQ